MPEAKEDISQPDLDALDAGWEDEEDEEEEDEAPEPEPPGLSAEERAARAEARKERQRARVVFAHDAGDHAELLDAAHRCRIGWARRVSAGLFHHDGEDTGPARRSIAWRYSRPARYDERTSGPDWTPAKPSSSASSASSSNSSGGTQRSIG